MNDSPEAVAATSKIVVPSMGQAIRLMSEKPDLDAIIFSPSATWPGVEIVARLEGGGLSDTDRAKVRPSSDKTAPQTLPANQAHPLDASIFNGRAADDLRQEFQPLRNLIEDDRTGLVWNDGQGSDSMLVPLLKKHTAAGFSTKLPHNVLQTLKVVQRFASGVRERARFQRPAGIRPAFA